MIILDSQKKRHIECGGIVEGRHECWRGTWGSWWEAPMPWKNWAVSFWMAFILFSFPLGKAQAFSVILRYRIGQPACTSHNTRAFHFGCHPTWTTFSLIGTQGILWSWQCPGQKTWRVSIQDSFKRMCGDAEVAMLMTLTQILSKGAGIRMRPGQCEGATLLS